MRQAIEVKYFPPTNTKGSYWKAICAAGSLKMAYNYDIGIDSNAKEACNQLIEKLDWKVKKFSCGVLKNGNYVFVITE